MHGRNVDSTFAAAQSHWQFRCCCSERAAWGAALRWFTLLALLIASAGQVGAGDWPQILGPQRSGVAAADEKLLDSWPARGPQVVWERSVGSGYAGVAIAEGRGVLFHRVKNEEQVEAFDPATGTTIWKNSYPTTFYPQVGGENGPLCVPTISQGRVITFGAQGILSCFDLKSGQLLWRRQTHSEFGADEGYFGAGSSPLVISDRVIVNVGGKRNESGVVAFRLEDGEVSWKKTDEPGSYSAPVSSTLQGVPVVLMVTRYKCLLLDPEKGRILFQFPFGKRGTSVNAASPLVWADRLFVTASYGIGSVYAGFDQLGVHPIVRGDMTLSTQYCTPIYLDGHLYVIDGRDDVPPADLKCVALPERALEGAESPKLTLRWIEADFGYGTLLAADGKLVAVKTDGELVLLRPDPREPKVLSRARGFSQAVRALPALSDGRLYVRDADVLKCLHVGRGL